jgi:two-component system chemotaxis response regulator CheY
MRALVIDDSRAMRALLRNLMTNIGFDVSEAKDGMDGLEHVEKESAFDVLLVDWNMPRMNGLEFVKAVRADASRPRLRLLMITTESEVSQMTIALEAGADEYLMKPFDRDALVGKLQLLGLECS